MTSPAREPWQAAAVCGPDDEAVLFPVGETDAAHRAGKAVCAPCPVLAECLSAAFALGADHGVWGGTTPSERRRMRAGGTTAAAAGPASRWVRS